MSKRQVADSTENEIAKVAKFSDFVSEKNYGINEYLTSNVAGIGGILKQRYSDFIVNEIDKQGNVITLSDLSYKKQDEIKCKTNTIETNLIEDKCKEQILELANNKSLVGKVTIDVTGFSKEQRKEIHTAIREFDSNLESTTVDENSKKLVSVTRCHSRQQRRWPANKPDYCYFSLCKENTDSSHVVQTLSKLLKRSVKSIHFAGTKDKRAVTTQLMCIYRIDPRSLANLSSKLKNISLGNYFESDQCLRLGYLQGNQFTVVLRDVKAENKEIIAAMESLATTGFINYFGLQRFGTTSVSTHEIGKSLLHRKWDEVVDLLLKPREEVSDDKRLCREVWNNTKDPEAALSQLPKYALVSAEAQILKGLIKFGKKNYLSAIKFLPRNLRTLYVHAYQSFIWNKITSKRFQQFGFKVLVGDLVTNTDTNNADICPDNVDDEEIADEEADMVAEFTNSSVGTVYITEENIANYTIYDILLPLPGYAIEYPKNTLFDWYKEEMSKDDLEIEDLKNKDKEFALPGRYRKFVMKPINLTWSLMQYDDYTLPLVNTDLDKIKKQAEPQSLPDGQYKAVVMKLALPACSYATMAIREVTKQETGMFQQNTTSTK